MPNEENNRQQEQQDTKPVQAARMVKRKPARASARKVNSLGELAARKQSARTVYPSLFLFTLYFLYKNLYYLGITILRRRLRYRRRVKLYVNRVRGSLHALTHRLGQAFRQVLGGIYRRLQAPFARITDAKRQQRPVIRALRAQGKSTFTAYLPIWEAVGRLIFKIIATIFNYTAPVLAGWFLLVTVTDTVSEPVGLLLVYNGQELGHIKNEAEFDSAAQIVRERVVSDASAQTLATDIPQFTLDIIDPIRNRMVDSSDLADMIFRTSDVDIEEAYGLYVSNRFLGAVTDKDVILGELTRIKNTSKTGKPNERVEFSKRIELTPLSPYPASSIVAPERIISELRANEDEMQTYTVEEGDSPSLVADKVRMPYSDLVALNPGIEESMFVGDELITQVARPYLSIKTIFTDVYEEEVEYETIEVQNATFAASYRDVTQEGENGLQRLTAEVTMINGIETAREVTKRETLREAVPERVTVGVAGPTVVPTPVQSGSSGGTASQDLTPSSQSGRLFIWPTIPSSGTTYRGHPGNGMDIAPGGAGHPIYAAASGTVVTVKSGWTGYGNYVIIDHGNGYQTLYAHNSQNIVTVGDQVGQGQVIAYMGRTGNATGNHVHFEVRLNGRYQNPWDYVGWSGP